MVCRQTCAWQPPTDVYETDDGIVVRVEVAGMRSENFSITLAGRKLIIAGTGVDPAPKRTYHQMEIHFGEFRVEVDLLWQVTPDEIEASYEEGFLAVSFSRPKSQCVSVESEQGED